MLNTTFNKKFRGICLLALMIAMMPLGISCASDEPADAVNFSVETTEGLLSIDQLRGQVVYIDFWASWCAPCRESFPWMNEMHHRYSDQGLRILAVGIDKTRELSDQFLETLPADFLIGFDHEGNLAQQFKLVGMPSAYILDRDGVLVKTHIGFRQSKTAEYEASIREILNR